MIKKNKKFLITITLLLIATLGVSVIAYTIAGSGSGKSENIKTNLNAYGSSNLENMEYVSNIDLIIEDSKEDDYMYNIINIVPGNVKGTRPIETYSVTDANFKNLVIDAHSENGGTMDAGKVRVITLPLTSKVEASTPVAEVIPSFTIPSGYVAAKLLEEDDEESLPVYTVATLLGSADLIYIESPSKDSYTGSYAMTDSIYSYLYDTYTGTNHNPIILDNINGGNGDETVTKTTYETLVNKIYNRYLYSPVFGWSKDQSVEDFLAGKGDSHYFAKVLNGKATGKILVLTGVNGGLGSGDWITNRFTSGELSSIYYGKAANYPENFEITYANVATLTDAAALQGYEFIIIEDSAMNIEVTDAMQDVYDELINLANLTQYIIYDSAYVDTSSTGSGNGSNKYAELLDNLLTSSGEARYYYVLPVKNGFFKTEAATTEGADAIADLINGSNYRGSETNGRNGKTFRVLELQPCYPIDTKLAESQTNSNTSSVNVKNGVKGDYYNKPHDLAKLAPEQVSDGQEYYAFELSKARIAKATGLKYNQITLDQMSTEEFITTKDVVLDTYDLVYIGGNFSALTPNGMKSIFSNSMNTGYLDYIMNRQRQIGTSFDMYTHTGVMVDLYNNNNYGTSYGTYYTGGTADSNIASNVAYGVYRQGGTTVETATMYNGNDITVTKYTELKNYIDAGMPILFSEQVSQAFTSIYNKGTLEKLSNSLLDPTSNMYAILDYAYRKYSPDSYKGMDGYDSTATAATNIVWNMNIETKSVKNTNQQWGSTDKITVFSDTTADSIKAAINNASIRPSLVIRKAPDDYVMADLATHYSAEDGQMSITVSGLTNNDDISELNVVLYVDKDANGTFDTEEEAVDKTTLKKGESKTLVYEFEQDDFYGLVSWKVVASTADTTKTTPPCDVKSGFAYFKRGQDVEKKEVRILQVMPKETEDYDKLDLHTLYLCTECQLAGYRAKYNLYNGATSNLYTNTEGKESSPAGFDIGLHEHKFGVVKYNSNGPIVDAGDNDYVGSADAGSEDWNLNYADDLADDYDFSMDILYLDELEEYAAIAKANRKAVNTGVDADGATTTDYVEVKMSESNTYTITDSNGNTITKTRVDENGDVIPLADASDDMTWVEYYQAKAEAYFDLYESAELELNNSTAKANMDAILTDLKSTIGENTNNRIMLSGPDAVQSWIDNQAYYLYFMYYAGYSTNDTNNSGFRDTFTKYLSNYKNWVTLHDKVVKYYNLYKKFSCYASTDENWLANNYDMVVLGFADSFNNKDMTLDECSQLKNYISSGGSVLLTHDTVTRYAEPSKGAYNLTNQLRGVFGLDRYHASIDTSKDSTGNVTLDYETKNVYVWVQPDDNGRYNAQLSTNVFYGPVTITNKDTTIKIVKDVSGLTSTSEGILSQIYPAANVSYDSNSSVTNGKNSVTVELYDTQQDLENGKLSTTWAKYDVVLRDANWTTYATISNASIKSGSATVQIDSGSQVLTGGLKFPFFTFEESVESGRQRYFITPWSTKQTDGESVTDRLIWQNTMDQTGGSFDSTKSKKIALIGITDAVGIYRHEADGHASPYKYAEYNWIECANPSAQINKPKDSIGGTDKVNRVNKGIVTVYPFTLGDELTVSATHAQSLATDMESTDMAVWYTLGATNSTNVYSAKTNSSLFAASPKDGMDSYFMYSYNYGEGTVNYCGAGHSVITGAGMNNNQERMLYVNIIVNSVRNSGSKPKIIVKDKDDNRITEETKGTLKLDNSGNLVYTVEGDNAIPEFNFDVKFSSLTNLSEVYVFYDLNYGIPLKDASGKETTDYSNKYTKDKYHILINHYTSPFGDSKAEGMVDTEAARFMAELRKGNFMNGENDMLQLKSEYFSNYDDQYTYLVIWAKDENGKTAYARIKINKTQKLFDLTDNIISYPDSAIQTDNERMDITDKSKFQI